ncbi:efflux transporter outer membrane subunit [Dyella silvae]|uniref:efflux transporter outer membrane subunit n=1 Tax=Dyella silvae TaxID=2994424 RepID=UPI0022655AF5|nr:efflux transporter outer membrane subunit [Dyella silvae]
MFNVRLLVAMALVVPLVACVSSRGLHPQLTPMQASDLSAGKQLDDLHATSGPWPDQDWWSGLGDSQLNELIDRALANSPDIALAEAHLREAQASVQEANAARGPDISTTAQAAGMYLPKTLPPPVGIGHYVLEKHVDAGLHWDLDLWGGKRAAWQAALGQVQVASAERQAARIALSINVARLYVELGHAFVTRDIAGHELDRALQSRDLTRQRVNAGIDGATQLRQIDAEVASDHERVTAADRDIVARRLALSALLGDGPDRGLAMTRPRDIAPLDVAVPVALPIELISHRADLTAARWSVEVSRRGIDESHASFMPDVSLGVLAGFVSLGGTNVLQLPARFYQVAPSISLPIYDGGRRRAELSARDAQYDAAVARYNATLVRSISEVADQLSALRSLGQQVEQQQQAYDAANDAWQLAEQRFRAGIGSFLETLVIRQQLLVAERHRADLRFQEVDSSILLIQALGGGYRPAPGETTPNATADLRDPP